MLTFSSDLIPCGYQNTARIGFLFQELTFVYSVLQITVFDSPAARGKFSCKNTPKFTARGPSSVARPHLILVRNIGKIYVYKKLLNKRTKLINKYQVNKGHYKLSSGRLPVATDYIAHIANLYR